jgi:hypothetical protein
VRLTYAVTPGHRSVAGIPFEPILIDPRALTVAADQYAEETGDVNEIALGQSIIAYLESERAA